MNSGWMKSTAICLYEISDSAYESAYAWLDRVGVFATMETLLDAHRQDRVLPVEALLNEVSNKFAELWEAEAGLKTFGQAVADAMAFHIDEGQKFDITVDEWLAWSSGVSHEEAREKAKSMGVNVTWDCELARTPEGYYPIQGGIEYAIAKSLGGGSLLRHHLDGDQDGQSALRQTLCRGDPRPVSRANVGLQSFAFVQLGYHRHDGRRDAGLPGRAGQIGVCVQLHHLRRTPGRRHGGGGICHRLEAGWHALAGSPAAQVEAGGVSLQDAPVAGGRTSPGWRL